MGERMTSSRLGEAASVIKKKKSRERDSKWRWAKWTDQIGWCINVYKLRQKRVRLIEKMFLLQSGVLVLLC